MNIKAFMIFVAIIATAYGLGFLLVPGHLVRLYGVATGPAVILGYRFFGVALLAIGLIFWFAKEFSGLDRPTRTAFGRGR